jgi:hypothetical protein
MMNMVIVSVYSVFDVVSAGVCVSVVFRDRVQVELDHTFVGLCSRTASVGCVTKVETKDKNRFTKDKPSVFRKERDDKNSTVSDRRKRSVKNSVYMESVYASQALSE